MEAVTLKPSAGWDETRRVRVVGGGEKDQTDRSRDVHIKLIDKPPVRAKPD